MVMLRSGRQREALKKNIGDRSRVCDGREEFVSILLEMLNSGRDRERDKLERESRTS